MPRSGMCSGSRVAGVFGAAGYFLGIARDLSVSVHKISWPRRLCRWGFLGAKIVLLLPIAYFVSLDLAYGFIGFNSTDALYLQMVAAFFICMFGMQWVLSDQRQRCPVCLRRVDHPVRVGNSPERFWRGMEQN